MTLVGFGWLAACTLAGALAVPVFARKLETGFLDRAISVNGTIYKYQVFVPDDWSPKQKWPIILFLHGAGERGSDGLLQTEVGMPSAVRKERSRFPAILVMPQCPTARWWTEPAMQAVALASLAAARTEFKGDVKKTYLTGLSMGGYGSLALAASHPGRFAAVVPICGGIIEPRVVLETHPEMAKTRTPEDPKSYARMAKKLGKTPIWIFHGEVDPIVPVEGSRKLYAALEAARGNVRYTEYPGVDHDSWEQAYALPELITWILSKSL